MKGFIPAAGVGSRLKPWTDLHPKALAPVGGVPMLQRVIEKMYDNGITDITVNVYHFADQIIDFIKSKGWDIKISDERPELLETGGALLKAEKFLCGDEPVLVHNADILSNADFQTLLDDHRRKNAMATLLVSDRDSSRKLLFDDENRLKGWHSLTSGEYRPGNFIPDSSYSEKAFSGIYIVSPQIIDEMKRREFSGKFSIMDFFLTSLPSLPFYGSVRPDLKLIDIGKPDSLNRANLFPLDNKG